MLSIRIEKEIRQDNRILAGLTMRQLIAVIVGVLACLLIWFFTGLDLDNLIIPWAAVGVACGAFGWVQKEGLHMEDYVLRTMQRIVFRNARLCYRTSNQYVKLYNHGLAQARDAQTPGPADRKEEKKKAKMRRKFRSRMKAYR